MRNINDIEENLKACKKSLHEVIAYLLSSRSEWEDEYIGTDRYYEAIIKAQGIAIDLCNELERAIKGLDDLEDTPF